MIAFFELLKDVVANVRSTGGDIIEHTTPPPQLLQQLREYAIQQIAISKESKNIMLGWFIEGIFTEAVRVCVIHFHKLGIIDPVRIYRVLTKVIDAALSRQYANRHYHSADFEEQLACSLDEIWYQMGDEQTLAYTFAKERLLISWDYQQSHWKTTNLGEFFLELSPVQGATFVLSIDTLFSTGKRDFSHINVLVLRGLLEGNVDNLHLFLPYEDVLLRLGIIVGPNEEENVRNFDLTPIGRIVLTRVLDEDNPFRDTASTLIKTEELGNVFRRTPSEIDEILEIVKENRLVKSQDRESIKTGVELYTQNKYLESLRIVFPSIEAIINEMLITAGEQPNRFSGLVGKTQWLEQHNIIPTDVSSAMEVFTGRNRVLHGNFSPPPDYVFPLCLLAFRYLRRLLTEYAP